MGAGEFSDTEFEVIEAAVKVGRYFKRHNMKQWVLGPCAAREPSDIAIEALHEIAAGRPLLAGDGWEKWRAELALKAIEKCGFGG